jgi:hypothetical protein
VGHDLIEDASGHARRGDGDLLGDSPDPGPLADNGGDRDAPLATGPQSTAARRSAARPTTPAPRRQRGAASAAERCDIARSIGGDLCALLSGCNQPARQSAYQTRHPDHLS